MTDLDALVRQVIQLAVQNVRDGGRPYAALVVCAGDVIGRGVNTVLRDGDPTAHAEVNAVRDACRALGVEVLDGAAMVTSCRPCTLCLAALSLVRIGRVHYAGESDSRITVQWPEVDLVHRPATDVTAPFELMRQLDGEASRLRLRR